MLVWDSVSDLSMFPWPSWQDSTVIGVSLKHVMCWCSAGAQQWPSKSMFFSYSLRTGRAEGIPRYTGQKICPSRDTGCYRGGDMTRTGWTQVYLNRLLEACSAGRTSQSVLPALGPLPGAISNGLKGQKVSLLSLWLDFFAGKLCMFFGVGSARRLSCWKVWKDLEVTGEIKSSSLHFPICKMSISNASALRCVFCLF